MLQSLQGIIKIRGESEELRSMPAIPPPENRRRHTNVNKIFGGYYEKRAYRNKKISRRGRSYRI